jgi:hypothetical protein
MGHLVIACYRPKPGQDAALRAAVHDHVPTLRKLGFATARPSTLLRAADGTLLELFEWTSAEAVERAHTDPGVQAIWGRFFAICDCVKLSDLAESAEMFPHFEPLTP